MCGARGAVHAWITVDVNADDSAQQSRVQSMHMLACTLMKDHVLVYAMH
jgi:hypothetical protein